MKPIRPLMQNVSAAAAKKLNPPEKDRNPAIGGADGGPKPTGDSLRVQAPAQAWGNPLHRWRYEVRHPILAIAAASAGAQGMLTGLGATDTCVGGMSADGSVVAGVRSNFGAAFRWSAGGAVNIGGAGAMAKVSRDDKM